ncbi:MAG: hypothetical protein AAF742_09855, partial [Pseudomonadota bacterium]
MRESAQAHLTADLQAGLTALLCEQAAHLARLDWSDPEAVALAEKRGRIIQVHRTNVEKTIGMNDHGSSSTDPNAPFDGDTEALKRELERRLLRHAEKLGKAELIRRLRARGIAPPPMDL